MSDEKSNESRCKGCGKRIVWAETADGKKIPLDPAAPTYNVVMQGLLYPRPVASLVTLWQPSDYPGKIRSAMVSHFATCPKAGDFGRGS